MAESKQYITQNQENGTVQISEDVIISIVTVAVGETEGVAGFSARLGSDIAEILGRKNWGKGVKLTITEDDRLYPVLLHPLSRQALGTVYILGIGAAAYHSC